jgi:hypothetical protein
MSVATYFLSKDCFVCHAQDYWIILNTKRDRYLCVTHADLMSIGSCLHGWEGHTTGIDSSVQPFGSSDGLVESLISNGIITVDRNEGKPFAESGFPIRESAIQIPRHLGTAGIPFPCVARFFLACARVDWRLRRQELSCTLAGIECRRRRTGPSGAYHDVACNSMLIAIFKELRPFYPRAYLCLFDSLALIEFLASYSFFPKIIFGVISDPFQAHCWVQDGSVVLNDNLERVEKYQPILSV